MTGTTEKLQQQVNIESINKTFEYVLNGFLTVPYTLINDWSSTQKESSKENKSSMRLHQRLIRTFIATILIAFIIRIAVIPLSLLLSVIMFIFKNLLHMEWIYDLLKNTKETFSIWNVMYGLMWYLPFVALFVGRRLKLFSDEPFWLQLAQKDFTFAKEIESMEDVQTASAKIEHAIVRVLKFVTLALCVSVLHLHPWGRYLVATFAVIFSAFKVMKKMHLTNSEKMNFSYMDVVSILIIACLMTLSVRFSLILCHLAEIYLTFTSISQELMNPYFQKMSWTDEMKCTIEMRWDLMGFGLFSTLVLYVPILGLVYYPLLQCSAANVLIRCMKRNKQIKYADKLSGKWGHIKKEFADVGMTEKNDTGIHTYTKKEE